MKLNKDFVTHMSNGKQVLVCVDRNKFSGMVRSNETAAFIIDLLKNEVSEEEIIETMLKEYSVDRETVEKDVTKVLETLRGINALDE